MSKLILILLDGLRFDIAQSSMGYLAHLVETAQATRYKVQTELPTLSRPLYEVLLTGTSVSINGITTNDIVRLSHQTSVFHLATQQGLTTAAVAYYWFSELYNRAPFNLFEDREQHDLTQPIQHGKFYFEDAYPDSHVFADAEVLRRDWNPDFLLVHPMGLDYAGHCFGSDSKQYRGRAIAMDSLLGQYLPLWVSAEYSILITADHGMNIDGQHGGNTPDVREVPLFWINQSLVSVQFEESLSQLVIASLSCWILSISASEKMISIHRSQ
jgi:predicted AlkP superfamily pyrophosphatase or phosphodiesterase